MFDFDLNPHMLSYLSGMGMLLAEVLAVIGFFLIPAIYRRIRTRFWNS